MSIFTNEPLFHRHTPLAFVPDEAALSGVVDHRSGILDVRDHVQQRVVCPLWLFGSCLSGNRLLLRGSRNTFRIQLFGNLSARLAGNDIQENASHHRRSLFVNDHLMFHCGMSFITIRDAAYIPGFLLFHAHSRLDLFREVFAVIVRNRSEGVFRAVFFIPCSYLFFNKETV